MEKCIETFLCEFNAMMAQPNHIRKISDAAQNSPGSISSRAQTSDYPRPLQGGGPTWSQDSSTPKLKKNQESDGNKKSVLSKVKEKARKLRKSWSGKKHRDENELRGPQTTPSSGFGLDDQEEEDPEYLGAPMYESEKAPETYKQARPREVHTMPSEKHVVTRSPGPSKNEPLISDKITVPEIEPKKQTSLDTSVPKTHEPKTTNTSQVDDVPQNTSPLSEPEAHNETETNKVDESGNSQRWDKGVSVKEYLMQKFEPGEDERALSQVITETICPKRNIMREAMSLFLKSDEPTTKISNSTDSSPNLGVSSSTDSNLTPNSSTVSTNLRSNLKSDSSVSDVRSKSKHDHGSDGANAAANLNQSFMSTAASYQNRKLGSNLSFPSSNQNRNHTNLNSSTAVPSPNPNQTGIPTYTNVYAARIPASTNTHQAVEDENRGRILQTN